MTDVSSEVKKLVDGINGDIESLKEHVEDLIKLGEKLDGGTKASSAKLRKVAQEVNKVYRGLRKEAMTRIAQIKVVRDVAQQKRAELEEAK